MVIKRRNLGLVSFLLFLFVCPCLVSADEDYLKNFPFRVQSFRPIRDLYYRSVSPEGVLIEEQRLRFRSDGYSSEYFYSGPRTIVFYNKTDSAGVVEFARVIIPRSTNRALLVFLSKDQFSQQASNEIICVDIGNSSASSGHVVFINTMAASFIASFGGGDTYTVFPGVNAPIRVTRDGNVRLALEVKDMGWQLVYGAPLPRDSNRATYIVLYPPVFAGGLDLRGAIIFDAVKSTEEDA